MPLLRLLRPALLLAALLPAAHAAAQQPAALTGRWRLRVVAFVVEGPVPDSVRDAMDDPQVADLNQAVARGEAQLLVDFCPDSSYRFTVTRDGRLLRDESGTYSLRAGHLRARSPASPDGSSFADQHLRRLDRRTLVLAFPVGPALPGVEEEVEYKRVR